MAEVQVQMVQVSKTASEGQMREHRVVVDRPVEKAGGNMGASGAEVFLSGFGGCFMSNLLAAIIAREVDIKDVKVKLTGTLIDNPTRFSAIHLDVVGDGADKAQMEKMVTIARRSCVIGNTIKDSVELSFTIQ